MRLFDKFQAAAALTVLVIGLPAHAVTSTDIMDESYFTFFNDLAPGVDGQGLPYEPTPAQNPIGTLADFEAPGIVAFMNNPPYYIFPTSPVALGFAGAAVMEIGFAEAMNSVSIGVRGTRAGTATGPAASGNPFGPSLSLEDAAGYVSVLDFFGSVVAGTTTAIENLDMASVAEIVFTAELLGQEIYGLRFEQQIDSSAAGLMLGGLGVTPVPEPGSGMLVGLGTILWGFSARPSLRFRNPSVCDGGS